jgi:hypothetical protein
MSMRKERPGYEEYLHNFDARIFNKSKDGRLRLDVNASMDEAKELGWFESSGEEAYLVRIRLYMESIDHSNRCYLDQVQEQIEGPDPVYHKAIEFFPSRVFHTKGGQLELNIEASLAGTGKLWWKEQGVSRNYVRNALSRERQDPRNREYLDWAQKYRPQACPTASEKKTRRKKKQWCIDDALPEPA